MLGLRVVERGLLEATGGHPPPPIQVQVVVEVLAGTGEQVAAITLVGQRLAVLGLPHQYQGLPFRMEAVVVEEVVM